MKSILIIVGNSLRINEGFVEYLKREACSRLGKIDSTISLAESDKDLFLVIGEAYEKYDNILVAAEEGAYATVSKIVATLFEDILEVKEENLVPSKAARFSKDSFLMEEKKKINVLKAIPTKRLPEIFIENRLEYAVLNIFDLSKEKIEKKLEPLANTYETSLIYTDIVPKWTKVVAKSGKYGDLAMFVQNAKLLMPKNLIISDNPFEYLIERFTAAKRYVTFAESCTGGALASMLTKVPGSSAVFKGSLVTYANEIKSSWLAVKPKTLKEHGAVSEETVKEMLNGALKVSESDYAVAISGIAGPGGGTPQKPVGTVIVGARSKEKEIVTRVRFCGDRNYIQYQAAMYGIKLLFRVAQKDLF